MIGAVERFFSKEHTIALDTLWSKEVEKSTTQLSRDFSQALFLNSDFSAVSHRISETHLFHYLIAYSNREAQRQAAGDKLRERWTRRLIPGVPWAELHLARAVLKSVDGASHVSQDISVLLRAGKAVEALQLMASDSTRYQVLATELLRIISVANPVFEGRFQQLLTAYEKAEAGYEVFFKKDPTRAATFRDEL